MSYEAILYDMRDGIAEIRLNRPHRLNAVTQTLYDELNDALSRAEADKDARVVLLTGEGRAFCVGADLKEHKAGRTAFDRRQYLQGEQIVCKRLMLLKKPVIAAVNGFALGAGAEVALASDFVLMARSAQIGLPEISIGNFLGGGVTLLLPRLVGLAKARELVFLVNASTAKRRCASASPTASSMTKAFWTLPASSPSSSPARRHFRCNWPRSSSTWLPTARSMRRSPPNSRA